MGKHRHTTLLIPDKYRLRLEEIARDLGYMQTRGAGAGRLGSISALVCAVARGDLELVPNRSEGVASNSRSNV
jgi:hypothetical protein